MKTITVANYRHGQICTQTLKFCVGLLPLKWIVFSNQDICEAMTKAIVLVATVDINVSINE